MWNNICKLCNRQVTLNIEQNPTNQDKTVEKQALYVWTIHRRHASGK